MTGLTKCKFWKEDIKRNELEELHNKENCERYEKASRSGLCLYYRKDYDGHCNHFKVPGVVVKGGFKWPSKKK